MTVFDIDIDAAQTLLADLCARLHRLGLEIGPSGNASVRCKDGLVITSSGRTFEDSAASDLAVVSSVGGLHVAGPRPSSDLTSHQHIYRVRSDVAAIVHTHAHHVTLAALLGNPIPVSCTMHADHFGGPIPVVPYSNHRTSGYGTAEHFSDGRAFLLQGHGGVLLMGEDTLTRGHHLVAAFEEVSRLHCDLGGFRTGKPRWTVPSDDTRILTGYYHKKYGQC